MKNLELFLAEVDKTSVAVYLACDHKVADDISNKLKLLASLLEDSLNQIEGYSHYYAEAPYYIPDEAKTFLKNIDKRMKV